MDELDNFPTPIQKLEKLGEAHGFTNLYVKRDDKSSPTYGGNKVRKLEWVLADAKAKGRKTLLCVGGSGSNQVLATTIYGKRHGLPRRRSSLRPAQRRVRPQEPLLDQHYGAELRFAANTPCRAHCSSPQHTPGKRIRGEKPYYVPAGASSPIGNMGYVNAAFEIRNQVEQGADARA